ncbi:MAG: [FeFe] hydrogenase, group A [Victivallaceae bacterium]|nr:[FeFe] hydrogenase, group A [Victivallaceae bacterium]
MNTNTVTVNGRVLPIEGERNLLELIRKGGIEIPTFCYHSELSIYGACRLCLVQVEKKGIMAACSTAPEAGMVIHTETRELHKMRKINIELLLANHRRECPSCTRSSNCSLQDLARRLGVETIRYKQPKAWDEIDRSSPSLERDPSKCILCGDCVRVCKEVQGIGAIDFANRGSKAKVTPVFGRGLAKVECVNCGQCAAVCPTGAIIPRQNRQEVWDAIYDPEKTVVFQIAPSVRVGLGELFDMPIGTNVIGKLVAALRLMGVDQIYDTDFAADMTIFEEATELIGRLGDKNSTMPMFTSCCPGWVKFLETYYPEFSKNPSSTRSPQQIFGAVARKTLPARLGVKPENLVVVSIMPCTAKKFEAQMPKFATNGRPDVDYVLTTTEIAKMIGSMGIKFESLEPEAFDMPLGFSTGGGVIFGTTGGVMEAALRFAAEKVTGKKLADVNFTEVRGLAPRKESLVDLGDVKLRLAVVHGLANARALIEDIKAGRVQYDFVEVMACPGGCVAGGGQPVTENDSIRKLRANGLYSADRTNQLQKPQDNYLVEECYKESFGGHAGSHEAHEALHTVYQNRSQVFDPKSIVINGSAPRKVEITVTLSARKAGSPGEALLNRVCEFVRKENLAEQVVLSAAFSARDTDFDKSCVTIGESAIDGADLDTRFDQIESAIRTAVNAL